MDYSIPFNSAKGRELSNHQQESLLNITFVSSKGFLILVNYLGQAQGGRGKKEGMTNFNTNSQ